MYKTTLGNEQESPHGEFKMAEEEKILSPKEITEVNVAHVDDTAFSQCINSIFLNNSIGRHLFTLLKVILFFIFLE